MSAMDWHPLVAPVVGHIGLDGKKATLPAGTIARIHTGARGLDAAGRADVAVHVVALAKMIWQSRGDLDVDGVIEDLAVLAATLMGDADTARDAFASQGVSGAATFLGQKRDLGALMTERTMPGAPVKVSRGLKRS